MNILKQQQGFMLAEVLVGIVIISVALLGISSMFVQASRTVTDSGSTAVAVNYAQREMEILKTKEPAWWNDNNNCSDSGVTTVKKITSEDIKTEYTVTMKVTNFTNASNLAKVNIKVSWNELDGKGNSKNRNIQYATLYNKDN